MHNIVQGDPKKTEPINFLITPTKIKQNYSNFVHLNFCLCMVIPQSFSNLGCFAQKLCSLQKNVRNDLLETDSHQLCKIVNHSHALFSGDFSDFYCNSSLEFTNCLRIVLICIVLQISPEIKIWGVHV